MADDEQFSLCWNNFNSNLSAGFHESLCRGDLVDVTLAAEGQFVKAHRLVLSVCSPYFRRMFTQMPANQHAFVFLKDVSHTALKDLIQFMYCGEVNVKQDALPAFISTAEALQIKGLTDSEPAPSQSPAKPSTPAPQPQPQTITTPTMTTATTTTSPRARTSNQRSRYKLESEDSGDENKPTNQLVLQQTQTTQQHQQATLVQQTQKRPAQRSITPHTAPTVKRIKNNDPLEGTDATTTTTQITVQAVTDSKSATGEPEYIDLPIDLPTKSEPDYGEEAADVEAAEQEATYVEDDSYGDMKYDESYFTENEEGGGTTTGATTSTAAVKQSVSFSDSYVSDTGEQQQAATEAQGYTGHHLQNRRRSDKSGQSTPKKVVSLVADTNGQKVVVYDGHHFKQTPDRNGALLFRCVRYETTKCPANILVTKRTKTIGLPHNHEDLATNEMPITSGRKVQVSSEKYAQIPSEKKGEIQFENKAQISSENKVHTPIRSNEKALSKGNLQIHSIQKVSKISVNRQKMTGVHLQLKKHKNRKVGSSAQKQSQSGSSNVDRDLPGKNGQYFDQNLSLNDFQSIFKQHFNIKD